MMTYIYIIAAVVVVWLGGLAFLRKVWFYRDPIREADCSENSILAPADGRVVYIKRVEGGGICAEKLGEKIPLPEITGCDAGQEGWAIGIYMSPLDVHFNYCPFPGRASSGSCVSAPRLNWPMLTLGDHSGCLAQENGGYVRPQVSPGKRANTIFLDGGGLKLSVVLIADKFVAKIRCFVEEGQSLAYSQKLGFIERGSQVDLIVFANNVEFKVAVNEQVYGGKTIIAEMGLG